MIQDGFATVILQALACGCPVIVSENVGAAELVTENKSKNPIRRSKSLSGYFFSDVFRRNLKLHNLGKKSLNLLDNVLRKSVEEGFEFINAKNFRNKFPKNEMY